MDEQDLVARLKQGEEAAQEELYKLYHRRLYATAVHFLGFAALEAEDAAQETFALALAAMKGFRGASSLYTWLNHICVNECFKRLKARRRLNLAQQEELESASLGAAWKAHQDRQGGREKAEALAKIKAQIAKLGGICRELLDLRYQEGLALAEIRRRLKKPIGTLSSQLVRCQEELRLRLRRLGLLEAPHD